MGSCKHVVILRAECGCISSRLASCARTTASECSRASSLVLILLQVCRLQELPGGLTETSYRFIHHTFGSKMMNVVCTQNMWQEGDQPGGGDQQGGTHPDHLAPQMGYMLPPAKRARILEPRVSQLSEYPLLSDSAAVAVWLWLCFCCRLAPLLLLSIWLCWCCCCCCRSGSGSAATAVVLVFITLFLYD